MSAFLSVDLSTDFAAFCLTDFIDFLSVDLSTAFAAFCLTNFIDFLSVDLSTDFAAFNRFYRLEIHLLKFCICDPACELLPPWTKELNLCTVAPLLYLLSDLLNPLPPSQCTVYTELNRQNRPPPRAPFHPYQPQLHLSSTEAKASLPPHFFGSALRAPISPYGVSSQKR